MENRIGQLLDKVRTQLALQDNISIKYSSLLFETFQAHSLDLSTSIVGKTSAYKIFKS